MADQNLFLKLRNATSDPARTILCPAGFLFGEFYPHVRFKVECKNKGLTSYVSMLYCEQKLGPKFTPQLGHQTIII